MFENTGKYEQLTTTINVQEVFIPPLRQHKMSSFVIERCGVSSIIGGASLNFYLLFLKERKRKTLQGVINRNIVNKRFELETVRLVEKNCEPHWIDIETNAWFFSSVLFHSLKQTTHSVIRDVMWMFLPSKWEKRLWSEILICVITVFLLICKKTHCKARRKFKKLSEFFSKCIDVN